MRQKNDNKKQSSNETITCAFFVRSLLMQNCNSTKWKENKK